MNARGREYIDIVFPRSPNLTLQRAAVLSGKSAQSILASCQTNQLYSLVLREAPDVARYPDWQFRADPARLAAAIKPWRDAMCSNSTMHDFFTAPSPFLDGLAPIAWILNDNAPIERVVELAKARLFADQTAG